jgi:hypothetical protein
MNSASRLSLIGLCSFFVLFCSVKVQAQAIEEIMKSYEQAFVSSTKGGKQRLGRAFDAALVPLCRNTGGTIVPFTGESGAIENRRGAFIIMNDVAERIGAAGPFGLDLSSGNTTRDSNAKALVLLMNRYCPGYLFETGVNGAAKAGVFTYVAVAHAANREFVTTSVLNYAGLWVVQNFHKDDAESFLNNHYIPVFKEKIAKVGDEEASELILVARVLIRATE